jgi:hypothetical protein
VHLAGTSVDVAALIVFAAMIAVWAAAFGPLAFV